MKGLWPALTLSAAGLFAGTANGNTASPVSVEIVGPDGGTFREIPLNSRDGALRSYLAAEKGARYEVRVRNTSGERLGIVIAVDGRNIINGRRSELSAAEPMYVLDAWGLQSYAGWRASLEAINEFYFTDWKDSYAEAFGDRTARGVIAIAVYREVSPPAAVYQPDAKESRDRAADGQPANSAPPAAERSAGTGYGDRRVDRAVRVEFVAQSNPQSRHFIKYEWRETLCRKRVMECGEPNRFWDESTLGFAPPPPRY